MLLSVIIYILFFSVILYLPDQVWSYFYDFFNNLYSEIKKYHLRRLEHTTIGKAENLQRFISSLESQLSLGSKSTISQIPEYHFYTILLEKLISGHRKFGMNIKSTLQELKLNLIKEIQFERKCQVTATNGKLQFLMMTITTWGFIFFSSLMVNIKMNASDYLIILLFQFIGVIIFVKGSRLIKEKIFSKYSLIIERLYLFINMVDLGFSNGKAVTESRILEGSLLQEKNFLPCAARLGEAIDKWKELGSNPKSECRDICEEIWHQKTMAFEHYLKQLEALKFAVLAGLYLPAYFYYLYSIFQFFMEQ